MKEEEKYKIINKKNGDIYQPAEREQKVLYAMAAYLDGREQFLSTKTDGSASILPEGLSEDILLSFKLQAERLKKLDLHMEIHEEWRVSIKNGGSLLEQPKFFYDGGQLAGRLHKRMKCKTSYARTPNWIFGAFQETLHKDYYIRELEDGSFQMVGEDILPQGVVSKAEVYNRSCDFWDERRWHQEKLEIGFSLFCAGIFCVIHLISLILFVVSMIGKFSIDLGMLAFFLWIVSSLGALPLSLYSTRMLPSYKRRKASAQMVQRVRSSIPEFCLNDFVCMAENRIKSIFYAGRPEKIAHFVNCDLYDFLVRYRYVANCETMNFWFLDFDQDGDKQYIDVRIMVRLTSKAQRYKMTQVIQYVKVRFTRLVDGIMTGDWYIEKVEDGTK